jgi:hypothetical protein
MAEFELKNKIDLKGASSQHTIVVKFDNPAYTEPERQVFTSKDEDGNDVEHEQFAEGKESKQLTFEQDVILPDSGTEKAAQSYADDYEKSFNESHKED